LDFDYYPFDQCLEHAIIEGLPDMFINIHLWENTEGGCLHRTMQALYLADPNNPVANQVPVSPIVMNGVEHPEYEASRWPKFLPALYELWKDHPDPSQNVQCDLSVKKVGDCKWEYIHSNGPVVTNKP
jgi:hypothetical protein